MEPPIRKITVKDLKNDKTEIQLKIADPTVKDLRAAVANSKGVPPASVKLVYKGTVLLDDAKKLDAIKITGDVITLITNKVDTPIVLEKKEDAPVKVVEPAKPETTPAPVLPQPPSAIPIAVEEKVETKIRQQETKQRLDADDTKTLVLNSLIALTSNGVLFNTIIKEYLRREPVMKTVLTHAMLDTITDDPRMLTDLVGKIAKSHPDILITNCPVATPASARMARTNIVQAHNHAREDSVRPPIPAYEEVLLPGPFSVPGRVPVPTQRARPPPPAKRGMDITRLESRDGKDVLDIPGRIPPPRNFGDKDIKAVKEVSSTTGFNARVALKYYLANAKDTNSTINYLLDHPEVRNERFDVLIEDGDESE